jgi:hypothetical protein
VGASLISGAISSALTNPMECITVNRQAHSDFKMKEFIKKEGIWSICTRGIVPRVVYNSLQSLLFFTALIKIGKVYNV